MFMNNEYKNYKIILLGNSNVGKSSLVERYINNDFVHKFSVTVGIDYKYKFLRDKNMKLSIWDTAGQEKYGEITKTYYRNCDCYLILFDITNKESFLCLDKWIEKIKNFSFNDHNFIVIVGTKKDLTAERNVSKNEIEIFVTKNKVEYFEISSKNNDNITMLFDYIIDKLHNQNIKTIEIKLSTYKKISSLLFSEKKQNSNKKC